MKRNKKLRRKRFGGSRGRMVCHQQALMWGNITRMEHRAPPPRVRTVEELTPEERERYGL